MEHFVYVCAGCGKDLTKIYEDHNTDRMPCPDCGSTKRNMICGLEEKIVYSSAISVKSKDAAGSIKYESRQRDDVSDKTGNPVKVSVDIDRTDSEKTVVTHKVEEIDKLTGYAQKIHEDTKLGKAKHRSKNK